MQQTGTKRHDWLGKVIHWELCKRFKFDHADKGYIQKPDFVTENEIYEILWDFDMQTNPQIWARRPG